MAQHKGSEDEFDRPQEDHVDEVNHTLPNETLEEQFDIINIDTFDQQFLFDVLANPACGDVFPDFDGGIGVGSGSGDTPITAESEGVYAEYPSARSEARAQLEQPQRRPKQRRGGRTVEPLGLRNWNKACYINSVLESLASVPEMVEHYAPLAAKTVRSADYFAYQEWDDLRRPFMSSERTEVTRKTLRQIFEVSESRICIGAYLGRVLAELSSTEGPAEAPASFLFAQACGTVLQSDLGEPFNGENPQECRQFLDCLLNRLDAEEKGAERCPLHHPR